MDVTQIPFARHTGIAHQDENILKLEASDEVQNHLQTIHASAQFTLAETQSGLFLQQTFPELANKMVGVLRSSTVKYRRPASGALFAHASLKDGEKEKFLSQLGRKDRAVIRIAVELRDESQSVIMAGTFDWFIHVL